jgi:hypothetical protein
LGIPYTCKTIRGLVRYRKNGLQGYISITVMGLKLLDEQIVRKTLTYMPYFLKFQFMKYDSSVIILLQSSHSIEILKEMDLFSGAK